MAKTSGGVRSSGNNSIGGGKTIKQREGFKTYETTDGIIEVPEVYTNLQGKKIGTIEWKLWEKNDKKRLYGKVYYPHSRPTDIGYYDLKNNTSFLSSRPVLVARGIEADIKTYKKKR